MDGEPHTGTYGLHDQIALLPWVRDSIAVLGRRSRPRHHLRPSGNVLTALSCLRFASATILRHTKRSSPLRRSNRPKIVAVDESVAGTFRTRLVELVMSAHAAAKADLLETPSERRD
jgi:hypothetical protein